MDKLFKATHVGELHIGEISITCYVLEDGRRLISNRGMMKALGMSPGSSGGLEKGDDRFASFVSGNRVNPFINEASIAMIKNPVRFITNAGATAFGHDAQVLQSVVRGVSKAYLQGKLAKQQMHIGVRAEQLDDAFSKIGIIALIDEATGYQYEREKDELQKILRKYISPELLPWNKVFPDEFYREIFRLNNWYFTAPEINKVGRPGIIGTWTKQYIYSVLPKGVLHALLQKTPRNEKGKLKAQLHRSLTREEGIDHLNKLIVSVVTLMNISDSWKQFNILWNKKFGQQMLSLEETQLIEAKVEKELPNLSDFNSKLEKGLNWNPKNKANKT